MPRYSSFTSARYADRRAAYYRKRRKRRWRRKPTSVKALTLARRALRRTRKPTTRQYWYRRPLDLLDVSASGNHHKYWAISSKHPYGAVDPFWTDANVQVVADELPYLNFRFPPSPTAAFADPTTIAGAPPDTSTSAIVVPNGTAVPGQASTYVVTDNQLNDPNPTNRIYLRRFRLWGDVQMNPSSASDAALVQDPDDQSPESTEGLAGWVRIIAVQQFKETADERDLTPADVFRYPISSSHQASLIAPMTWTYKGYTRDHGPTGGRNNLQDDSRVTASGAAPPRS